MSLAQLSRLLPLPEEDLQQVLDYASTLSKEEAVEHFNNLLGESSQSIEFISSYNSYRQAPTHSSSSTGATTQYAPTLLISEGVPKFVKPSKKKKAPLHALPPRQIQETYTASGTAYTKKNEEDYMAKRLTPERPLVSAQPKPKIVAPAPRAPPSAAGTLISDFKKSKSNPTSRTSSPGPLKSTAQTKVFITGGKAMHGASQELNELDAAIRSLEISTNSTLLLDASKRRCNCIGARHALLTAAPNCLNCGKVICVKEGLGPCTFCGEPLISAIEIQGMIQELREERGREKMVLDAATHRRADVASTPVPFSAPRDSSMTPAEVKAKEHRDRLLGYQAQNAKRTTVRDEAADFETPITSGLNMWASPAERAKQLKKQQKVLAEQEWNAKPEYEKRRQVVSIDLVKGKVVKKMGAIEKPSFAEDESGSDVEMESTVTGHNAGTEGGTFSHNPLLGGLIKPVYHTVSDNLEGEERDVKKKSWRRVQDDLDDNEAVILDGGVYGRELQTEIDGCG